ncbi:MAG: (4Fe-4S)-binding protein [Cyclobacteriaceae bacterium]|nr:(4Fe-4S)-binding protein [Cyclobacteriaceae bacterium]
MEDPRNRQYTNGEVTVFWKPAKCIHATTCFRELIEVFNPGRRPWVNMEGAPTRRIIEVVNKCPTQALEWKHNKEMDQKDLQMNQVSVEEETPETLQEEDNQRPVKVNLMKNGPIVVEGDFNVIGADGNMLKTMLMTSFCRCGGSRSMPYCDGTHRKIGFTENDEGNE